MYKKYLIFLPCFLLYELIKNIGNIVDIQSKEYICTLPYLNILIEYFIIVHKINDKLIKNLLSLNM